MSIGAIFLLGLFVFAMVVVFVYLTIHEMRRSPLVAFDGGPPDDLARHAQRSKRIGSARRPASSAHSGPSPDDPVSPS